MAEVSVAIWLKGKSTPSVYRKAYLTTQKSQSQTWQGPDLVHWACPENPPHLSAEPQSGQPSLTETQSTS